MEFNVPEWLLWSAGSVVLVFVLRRIWKAIKVMIAEGMAQ